MCSFIIFSAGPRIQLSRGEYIVHVGNSLTAHARVESKSPVTVTWMLDGKDVSSDEDIVIETDGDDHRMRITKTSLRHAGTYTIKAENDYMVDTKDITIKTEFGKFQLIMCLRLYSTNVGD